MTEEIKERAEKELIDPRRVLQILECKRRILEFVESMLDNNIDERQLRSGLNLISHSDWDDIIQERYLLRICGFPLCSKSLTKDWKQKFHISFKDKKIYDTEERKLYCSISCMKQSNVYKKEKVPTEPIWFRESNLSKYCDTNEQQ